ncbi:hypothetical protein [Brevibacillus parabrevis]|uniref:hypothetical protein n=1 Tax=Brevibacillus parabrevis TaxID=54914 RepID=UPI001F618B80|nr:hypothetical protein [Brevibacillus parabrevis]
MQSFAEANIGSFAVFGFTHEHLETLNATLTPSEVRSGSNIFQIVNTFKSVLQLEEMSWINYDHVVEDANYDLMLTDSRHPTWIQWLEYKGEASSGN